MKVTERRKGKSLIATLTSALLVASGLALAPTVATAAPAAGEGTVTGATLEWGVKESFRNYIGGVIARGKITMLGGAQQNSSGTFAWAGGSGTAAADGTAADVAFAAGDGVHFQGHSMQIDGETKYVLDGSFSAPRIVVTSATTAELRMDVAGYEFKSTTEIGEPYSLTDAPVATLQLPTSTVAGDVRTWTNAPATLTTEGAIAFGGGAFYKAGDALDPVSDVLPPRDRTGAGRRDHHRSHCFGIFDHRRRYREADCDSRSGERCRHGGIRRERHAAREPGHSFQWRCDT